VPELPEAETIVRGLRPTVVGSTIQRTEVLHEDILRESRNGFAAKVRGRTIVAVERRGKNVLLVLDARRLVAVNLGMTGRLLPYPAPPAPTHRSGHPAVRFRFVSGATLVFDDTRRFGTVECLSAEEWLERSQRMGPEPLDESFTPDVLHAALRVSRAPVRSWLLDQRRVAGVGNIYANEALHLARIHPATEARAITRPEAGRLHAAVREVLGRAIGAGGTTIRDYRNADGEEGLYARSLLVYDRTGEPCARCGRAIRRTVFGGRSAFHCPGCQRRRQARRPTGGSR
jgi:formamidopyrimidine-DNA glycosylase